MSVGFAFGGEVILEIDDFDEEFTIKINKEKFDFLKSSGGGMQYTPSLDKEHIIKVVFKSK
jgi:hypothetical protein